MRPSGAAEGGGAAGASAVLSDYAGTALTAQITGGTTSSGSVSVSWRQAPGLTIGAQTTTIFAGDTARIPTHVTFPSGFQVGATYEVTLEGHQTVGALSRFLDNSWSFVDVKAGTWTVTVRAVPWDPAMGTATATAQLVVVGGTTSEVELTTSASRTSVGDAVTLTATARLLHADGTSTAAQAGTVRFYVDGVAQGSAHPVGGMYTPTLVFTPTSAGSSAVTARYSPTNPDVSGSESAPLTIEAHLLPVGLTATIPSTGRADEDLTLRAATGGDIPGTFHYTLDDGAGSPTVPVASADGSSSFTLPAAAEGTYTATVTFVPDATRYATETVTTTTIVVSRGETTTALSLPAAGRTATPVTATARVQLDDPDDTRTPTGSVTFATGAGDPLATSSAPTRTGPGWAEYSAELTRAGAGDLDVVANYAGSAAFRPSQSATATTALAAWATATSGVLSTTTVQADRTAELRVRVRAVEADAPELSGGVQLLIDGAPSGDPAALVGGVAVLTVPSGIAFGERRISASFADAAGTFAASTSAPETLTVTRIPAAPDTAVADAQPKAASEGVAEPAAAAEPGDDAEASTPGFAEQDSEPDPGSAADAGSTAGAEPRGVQAPGAGAEPSSGLGWLIGVVAALGLAAAVAAGVWRAGRASRSRASRLS